MSSYRVLKLKIYQGNKNIIFKYLDTFFGGENNFKNLLILIKITENSVKIQKIVNNSQKSVIFSENYK